MEAAAAAAAPGTEAAAAAAGKGTAAAAEAASMEQAAAEPAGMEQEQAAAAAAAMAPAAAVLAAAGSGMQAAAAAAAAMAPAPAAAGDGDVGAAGAAAGDGDVGAAVAAAMAAGAAAVANNGPAHQHQRTFDDECERLRLMYPSAQSARKSVLAAMRDVGCSKLERSELSNPAKGILSGTMRMTTSQKVLTVPVQLQSSGTGMTQSVRGAEERRCITLSVTARAQNDEQLWLQAYLWMLVYLFHGVHPTNRPNTDAWGELVAVIG